MMVAATGGTAAFAQDAPAPAPTPAATDTPAPPPAGSGAASPSPAGSASPEPAPSSLAKGALTGYGYGARSYSAPSSGSAPVRHRGLFAHHPNEAVATFTGFEMLADGGSRLFVQLSKQVDVEQERAEARSVSPSRKAKKGHPRASAGVVSWLKFVLKGTEVLNPMNEQALVTVHFNTPVVRARLVPAGKNLDLMVELRADVTPQMKVVPAKDNGSMLQVDFPQGSYLPGGAAEPAAQAPDGTGGGLPQTAPPSSAGASDSTGQK